MATIAIRFCDHCSNMLYPQGVQVTDGSGGKLVYRCRICQRSEEVDEPDNSEAYRICSTSSHRITSELKIGKEFSQDPTLSRCKDIMCPVCKKEEVVFFQNDSGGILTRMELIYVCANPGCNHHWAHESGRDYHLMDDDDSD